MSFDRVIDQLGRTRGVESVFVLDDEGSRLAGSGPIGGAFLDEATADLQFLLDAASELVGEGMVDLQYRDFALRIVRAAPYRLGVLTRADAPVSVVDLAVRVASRQLARVPKPAPAPPTPGRESLDDLDDTTLPSAGTAGAPPADVPRHERRTAPPSAPGLPPMPPARWQPSTPQPSRPQPSRSQPSRRQPSTPWDARPSSRHLASERQPRSSGAIDPRTGRPAVSRQPATSEGRQVSPWARASRQRKKKAGGIWGK